jgi:hypothetical protein
MWIDGGSDLFSCFSLFGAVDGVADVADAHRRAVVEGQHHVVERSTLGDLVIAVDGEGLGVDVDAALGRIGGSLGDDGAHVLEAEARGLQLDGVDLHANGRLLLAGDLDAADAGKLGDLLDDDVFDVVVDGRHGQNVGLIGIAQDRCVGGVHLLVSGRRG